MHLKISLTGAKTSLVTAIISSPTVKWQSAAPSAMPASVYHRSMPSQKDSANAAAAHSAAPLNRTSSIKVAALPWGRAALIILNISKTRLIAAPAASASANV